MSTGSCGCGSLKNLPGQRLRFLGYNPDEVFENWGPGPYPLRSGDVVEVCNCGCLTCGIGIDVMRLSDGQMTMVFPEEVAPA